VSELYGPVESGLERSVGVGDLRTVVQKKLHRLRLTFPAGAVQRCHVLLVRRIHVSALQVSNTCTTSTALRCKSAAPGQAMVGFNDLYPPE